MQPTRSQRFGRRRLVVVVVRISRGSPLIRSDNRKQRLSRGGEEEDVIVAKPLVLEGLVVEENGKEGVKNKRKGIFITYKLMTTDYEMKKDVIN